MLNFLCFFVSFNAVKTDTKLTLHHMGKNFYYLTYQDKIWSNLKAGGLHFFSFLPLKKLLRSTSGFSATDDLPHAQ